MKWVLDNIFLQNAEFRRKLDDEQASYKRKLQAYQEGQQRQAQLVQKLQSKVSDPWTFKIDLFI